MPNLYFTNPPQTTDSPDTHIARISVATTRGSSNLRGIDTTTGLGYLKAAATGAATNALVTAQPPAGKTLVITDLIISGDTALELSFKEESSASVIFTVYISAHGCFNLNTIGKFKLNTAAKALTVSSNQAGAFSVLAFYYYE